MAAPNETPIPRTPAGATPTPEQAECPNLESRLYRLTLAEDPAAYASSAGLRYIDGKVRVVIELSAPDENLPGGYDITVESRQGALAQALVPVSDLCRLSNEPQVRFVRAPIEPVR